jgi:hypothetical protein
VGDAEAVLFVDDDEGETVEPDGRLDQRVCADQKVDLPPLEGAEQRLPLAPAHPAGQEPHADARRRQPRGEAVRVLLGEDLRRSHESALDAAARGDQEGETGDDGLAASDVALEEARHRSARREVAGDLADGAPLRVRQPKRQSGPSGLADPGGVEHDSLSRMEPGPLGLDRSGKREKLLVGEYPARRVCRLERGRKVRGLERAAERLRSRGGPSPVGAQSIESAAGERAPGTGGDVGHAVVDADDAAGVHRIRRRSLFRQELRLGVLDAQVAGRPERRGAVEHGRGSLGPLRERGIPVVPDDPHRTGSVVGEGFDAQSPAPHAGRPDAREPHLQRRRLEWDEAGDRREAAAVLVAEREREQEVPDGRDAGRRELRRPRRAHAPNRGDGISGSEPAIGSIDHRIVRLITRSHDHRITRSDLAACSGTARFQFSAL